MQLGRAGRLLASCLGADCTLRWIVALLTVKSGTGTVVLESCSRKLRNVARKVDLMLSLATLVELGSW